MKLHELLEFEKKEDDPAYEGSYDNTTIEGSSIPDTKTLIMRPKGMATGAALGSIGGALALSSLIKGKGFLRGLALGSVGALGGLALGTNLGAKVGDRLVRRKEKEFYDRVKKDPSKF